MTTWHVDRDMDPADQGVDSDEGASTRPPYAPTGAGGTHLLATAASRVWEELYIGKKPVGHFVYCNIIIVISARGPQWK